MIQEMSEHAVAFFIFMFNEIHYSAMNYYLLSIISSSLACITEPRISVLTRRGTPHYGT